MRYGNIGKKDLADVWPDLFLLYRKSPCKTKRTIDCANKENEALKLCSLTKKMMKIYWKTYN